MADNAPTPAQPSSPKSKSKSTLSTVYLALYNYISAVLWAVVLFRVVTTTPVLGNDALMQTTGAYVQWVQTVAVLEILHSLLGIVRAPLLTTLMQVSSRLLIVRLVYPFCPGLASSPASWPNSTMLLAWSATEVVRYAYFFFSLLGGLDVAAARHSWAFGGAPGWLKWLRYNGFWVLYPVGIASECWMVANAIPIAARAHWGWAVVLGLGLAAYVPGAPVLYSRMMRQRRKVMSVRRDGATAREERKTQ